MSDTAICRAPDDEAQSCPFCPTCSERRQRIAAGYALLGGGDYSKVPLFPAVRGTACAWYQWGAEFRRDLLPQVEVDVERAALQDGL